MISLAIDDKPCNRLLSAFKIFLSHSIYKNGQYYIGEFKDGSRHGQGTYWYEDGRKYVGEYENNKRNGKGMEYTADGQIFMEGEWVDGQYVGKG